MGVIFFSLGLGRATTRLLRRVLRRVLETAFEKVPRRVLRRCLPVGFRGKKVLRRVLRRGSKKALRRRYLEGRSTPFESTTPFACALLLEFLDCSSSYLPRSSQAREKELVAKV